MLAQLNFNEYCIDEFSVVANRDYVPVDAHSIAIDVDFDIRRNAENPLDFMVSLMVDLNNSKVLNPEKRRRLWAVFD